MGYTFGMTKLFERAVETVRGLPPETQDALARLVLQLGHVIESRGWRYEIASEPAKVEFMNVRFLAGYRRASHFDADVLAAVRSSLLRDDEARIGPPRPRLHASDDALDAVPASGSVVKFLEPA